MNKKEPYDLNDIISETELEKAKKAGKKTKERLQTLENQRKNNPDFEDWYAKECKKTENELKDVTIHTAFKELDEIHKHCRGL